MEFVWGREAAGVNTEAAKPTRLSKNGPLSGKVLFLEKVFESPYLEQQTRKEPSARLGQPSSPDLPVAVAAMSPHFLCVGSMCVCKGSV